MVLVIQPIDAIVNHKFYPFHALDYFLLD